MQKPGTFVSACCIRCSYTWLCMWFFEVSLVYPCICTVLDSLYYRHCFVMSPPIFVVWLRVQCCWRIHDGWATNTKFNSVNRFKTYKAISIPFLSLEPLWYRDQWISCRPPLQRHSSTRIRLEYERLAHVQCGARCSLQSKTHCEIVENSPTSESTCLKMILTVMTTVELSFFILQ